MKSVTNWALFIFLSLPISYIFAGARPLHPGESELLALTKKCAKSNSAEEDKDMENMYKALVHIQTDKRCGIKSLKVIKEEDSRGLGMGFGEPDPCENAPQMDPESSGISAGRIDVVLKDGTTNTIRYDANHFDKMSVGDWLVGKKGHKGFYKQLESKGICVDQKKARATKERSKNMEKGE